MFDTQVDPRGKRRLEEPLSSPEEFPPSATPSAVLATPREEQIWRTSSEQWAALASTVIQHILWSALVQTCAAAPPTSGSGKAHCSGRAPMPPASQCRGLDALGRWQFLFEMLGIRDIGIDAEDGFRSAVVVGTKCHELSTTTSRPSSRVSRNFPCHSPRARVRQRRYRNAEVPAKSRSRKAASLAAVAVCPKIRPRSHSQCVIAN